MRSSLDSNFGSGAELVFLGSDLFGGFSITTGSGVNPFGGTVTFTFSSDLSISEPSVLIARLDATTAAISALAVGGGQGGFTFQVEANAGNPITDNTTYRWAYRVA